MSGDERGEQMATDLATPPVPRAKVTMLRAFEINISGSSLIVPQGAQRLVAFLALRDRPQLRTTVATSLWMDTTEDRAAANLRTALWKLADMRDLLIHSLGSYLTLAPGVEVDFSRLLTRVKTLIDGDGDINDFDASTGDLAGDLLPDWDEDWLLFERERLRQLRIHALEALSRRLCAAGRYAAAVDAGLSAVTAEPLRESAQRVLIEVHLAEGNVSEARRQFELYRAVLWDNLALLPSASLCSLVGVMGASKPGEV